MLALTFSTVCTVWAGRWSALRENMAFIRAALRTTYGLREGLEVAQQIALEGSSRMKPRVSMSSDVTAQFWEELVGRVVDQMRALARVADQTVANWQEFAPEEAQRLSEADRTKADALDEVTVAMEQTRAVLDTLKDSLAAPETARLQARITSLEEERARINASSALAFPASGEARRLLAAGAIEEAIASYSTMITASPDAHTLYIQRARARFLAGDATGALADLDEAEARCSTDPSIARLRTDIKEGKRPPPLAPTSQQPLWREDVAAANNALAAGNGRVALERFQAARKAGLLPVFAIINDAMAHLLLGEPGEARAAVERALPTITGPYVRVQALALLALCDVAEKTDSVEHMTRLTSALRDLRLIGSRFELADSPLQHLALGFYNKNMLIGEVGHIFELLQSSP